MGIRKQPLITNQYYHIYNRGVDKRDIFNNKNDLYRFIESIVEFNKVERIGSLTNLRKLKIVVKPLSKEPLVSIIAYCLNPNHFHFILKQLVDGGLSKFMQKLQGGYTYYFNMDNSRTGSLFQGTFKSNIIDDENYFNKVLGYVNNNDEVHDIPKNKKHLVFRSAYEYESNQFKIVTKSEGDRILKIFGGNKKFEKHCKEIISAIRKERGKISLLEDDNLPDSG